MGQINGKCTPAPAARTNHRPAFRSRDQPRPMGGQSWSRELQTSLLCSLSEAAVFMSEINKPVSCDNVCKITPKFWIALGFLQNLDVVLNI